MLFFLIIEINCGQIFIRSNTELTFLTKILIPKNRSTFIKNYSNQLYIHLKISSVFNSIIKVNDKYT